MFTKPTTEQFEVAQSLLLLATRDGDLQRVKHLVEDYTDSELSIIDCENFAGNTPLHVAILRGHVEIVAFLVNSGANIYHQNKHGCTPFEEACLKVRLVTLENKYHPESIQTINNFKKIVMIFLSKKFNLNATSSKSKSYLGELASTDAVDAMQILFNCGADVNIRDQFGWSPLHYAAMHGRKEAFQWLIRHEADVHAVTNQFETAASLAAKDLKLFYNRGVDGHFAVNQRLYILDTLNKLMKERTTSEDTRIEVDETYKISNMHASL